MEKPLISVLVPVYNKAPYLARTVEAILAQDWPRLEVVLVDDGSTDGSGPLCDALAARDPRVRVAHRPNGGVAAARNTALARARGDYVSWVDADDLVMPGFLTRLQGLCRDFGTQVAMCRIAPAPGGGQALPAAPEPGVEPDTRMAFEEYCALIYTVRGFEMSSLCNKLFRRALFQGERFPEGRNLEDEYMTWRLVHKAGGLAVSTQPLYYYVEAPESVMHGAKAALRRAQGLDYLDERVTFLQAQGLAGLATRAMVSRQLILCEILQALAAASGPEERALAKNLRRRGRAYLRGLAGRPGAGSKGLLRLALYLWFPARFAKARAAGATAHVALFLSDG